MIILTVVIIDFSANVHISTLNRYDKNPVIYFSYSKPTVFC